MQDDGNLFSIAYPINFYFSKTLINFNFRTKDLYLHEKKDSYTN